MLGSSAISGHVGCIDVHVMSPLRGGASSIFVTSVPISTVSLGWYSKGFVHGLSSVLTVLFRGLPFDVLIACFFLPIFEFPRDFCPWVIVGGAYDCFDEFSFEVVFQDFDGSMVIEFDIGIFDQAFEIGEKVVKTFSMSEFAEFLVCFCLPIGIRKGSLEGIHEVVPKGFVKFKRSTVDFIVKMD